MYEQTLEKELINVYGWLFSSVSIVQQCLVNNGFVMGKDGEGSITRNPSFRICKEVFALASRKQPEMEISL